MRESVKLFKTEHFEKHENPIRATVWKFILGYKSLEQFLELGIDENSIESLRFYSNLYNDMAPILTEISSYVYGNGYIKKREKIKNGISESQKILGLLKLLHMRYIITLTSPYPLDDPRWDEITEKSNKEIVKEIESHLDRIYPFKLLCKDKDE